MDPYTYKRKRASLVDEEEKCYEQLRAHKHQCLEKHKLELDIIQKLYESKKKEYDDAVKTIEDNYYDQKRKIRQSYDDKLNALSKEAQPIRVYEDKKPLSWDESLDILINSVASKYTTETKIEKVHVTNVFKPPMKVWHGNEVIATYYGNSYPSEAKLVSHLSLASKRILYNIIEHISRSVHAFKNEIMEHLKNGKQVEVVFQQAEDSSRDRKFVFQDCDGRFFIVYFNYIFENKLSKKILNDVLVQQTQMRLVSTTRRSCIVASL